MRFRQASDMSNTAWFVLKRSVSTENREQRTGKKKERRAWAASLAEIRVAQSGPPWGTLRVVTER